LPRYIVGSRQAEYKLRRVDRSEDDIVKSIAIALYRERDEPIIREGL